MRRLLERLLDLRSGELHSALVFSLYYFLVIAANTTGMVVRDTLFLEHFPVVDLPYADMGAALLVGVFVAIYIPLVKWVSLRDLLVGSLLLFSACIAFFEWGIRYYPQWQWLYLAFYMWVSIMGAVSTAQVWTLANYLMTTREAKRLFGIIGSGGILGGIFSGFFSHVVAKRFGTESLLVCIGVFLLICPVLAISLWGKRELTQSEAQNLEESPQGETPRNFLQSFQLVIKSPHLKLIASLICLSSIVTTLVSWQFKAIAKESLVGADALAAFFGSFYGYSGLLGFLTQTLLTSRILRRFGLGVALFTLPSALFAGSAGMLVWGTLWTVTLLRGCEKVFRYSIDSSAVQLLYLPVSSKVKIQAKAFIDSAVGRTGDGLAALVLLVFATFLHLSPRQMSWISLAMIGLWLTTAYLARRQYVATLREWIHTYRLSADPAAEATLERSLKFVFSGDPSAVDPEAILQVLSQVKASQQSAAHPELRLLLEHPSPAVCLETLSVLDAAGDKGALPQVQRLLQDLHIEVRAKALSYLGHYAPLDPLANFQDLSPYPKLSIRTAMVSFLAHSSEPDSLVTARLMLDSMVKEEGPDGQKTRWAAARLIGSLPDCFEEQLAPLLEDPDLEIESAAISAVGKLRQKRFVPRLLERLSDSRLQMLVVKALGKFGNSIVKTLHDHLLDPSMDLAARCAIPGILVRIGTQEAAQALHECLLNLETSLRLRILSALNKLRQSRPEIVLDLELIEVLMGAEILGYYRSYQILGKLGEQSDIGDTIRRALDESMKQELERIFRLMQLLYPLHDLHSAYFGLQSKDHVVHDNALEFLDNILKPAMRNLLVPLLDCDVSVADRVALANRLVGNEIESKEDAIVALMRSRDAWLVSAGAFAIGALGLKSLEPELEKHLENSDPLVQEAVQQAKARLADGPEN